MIDTTITFEITDFSNPRLESLAISISEAATQYRGRVRDLVQFLKRSGNTIETYKKFFVGWEQFYVKRKSPPDIISFRNELKKIESVCQNDTDWQKLRGLIAEEIYKKYFESEYEKFRKSYGSKVKINNKDVIYSPQSVTEKDRRKVSVDAGSWNGIYGEFVEVKLSASAIEEKDLNYMQHLHKQLSANFLAHKLTIICFDDEVMIKGALIESGIWNDNSTVNFVNYYSLVD